MGTFPAMSTTLLPVADPAEITEILTEIRHLRQRGPLAAQGKLEVFLAAAWEIPSILHEIGRLREIAFRAVGEGSGKVIDLDRFEAVRGKADIKWRTDELMTVLRGDPRIKSRFRGDSS